MQMSTHKKKQAAGKNTGVVSRWKPRFIPVTNYTTDTVTGWPKGYLYWIDRRTGDKIPPLHSRIRANSVGQDEDLLRKQEARDAREFFFALHYCGWKVVEDRDAFKKMYAFKSSKEAAKFVRTCVVEARRLNCYPEWNQDRNIVKVTLPCTIRSSVTLEDAHLARFMESMV